MTETEKTIRSLEALRTHDTDYAYDLKVAIKALRACAAIQEYGHALRASGTSYAPISEIEELLP